MPKPLPALTLAELLAIRACGWRAQVSPDAYAALLLWLDRCRATMAQVDLDLARIAVGTGFRHAETE